MDSVCSGLIVTGPTKVTPDFEGTFVARLNPDELVLVKTAMVGSLIFYR